MSVGQTNDGSKIMREKKKQWHCIEKKMHIKFYIDDSKKKKYLNLHLRTKLSKKYILYSLAYTHCHYRAKRPARDN